jgi:dTDP-4-amino-4,6-dideoxygalactose transaminase
LQQLNDLEMLIEKQRKNASRWTEWICENFPNYILLNQRKENLPNYWVYGILADNKTDALNKFRDMGYYASGVHFPNNYYSIFGNREILPGVDKFYSKFLAIPCGWWFQLNI